LKDTGKGYTSNEELFVKIPLKIPIERFLILKNLKYLLSWMGKWEIRCYFDLAALIIAPIVSTFLAHNYYNSWEIVNDGGSTEFTQ
jgi:hypothetical protein